MPRWFPPGVRSPGMVRGACSLSLASTVASGPDHVNAAEVPAMSLVAPRFAVATPWHRGGGARRFTANLGGERRPCCRRHLPISPEAGIDGHAETTSPEADTGGIGHGDQGQ